MIFVTVGTHEQPFDRLVSYMDAWAKAHDEEVIIQTGYSTYQPQHCTGQAFFPYREMIRLVDEARIVITHGGPSSFIMPLEIGKIPVVVPRKKEFGEHVNDHQLDFCRKVAQRSGNILVAEDTEMISDLLEHYEEKVRQMPGSFGTHNAEFCSAFAGIVEELFKN